MVSIISELLLSESLLIVYLSFYFHNILHIFIYLFTYLLDTG